jgi:hypothetical protein
VALGTDLIRAPLQLGLSVAERVLDAGIGLLRGARSLLEPEERAPSEPSPAEREGRPPAPSPADAPASPARAEPAPPTTAAPAVDEPAPSPPDQPAPFPPVEDHVDEGVVLAAEAAEAGAEEGAHAELHVEEPWEGYDRMRVGEITTQLEGATREALATVELYERTHRGRPSVLEAADRRLRELSGRGAVAGRRESPVSGS